MRKTQARQAIVDLLSKSDRPVPARDIAPLVLSEKAIDSFTPQLPLLQVTGGCRPMMIEGVPSVEIQWFTGESYEKSEKYTVDCVGCLCKRCC